MKIIPRHFFHRGHSNELSNLTGSLQKFGFIKQVDKG